MTCYLTILLLCFLADERELQERLNRGVELDEKAEQLKIELQQAQEAALKAALVTLENATETTIKTMTAMVQEGRQVLNDAKETALNISRQGESAVVGALEGKQGRGILNCIYKML